MTQVNPIEDKLLIQHQQQEDKELKLAIHGLLQINEAQRQLLDLMIPGRSVTHRSNGAVPIPANPASISCVTYEGEAQ